MPAKIYDFSSRRLLRSQQNDLENVKEIPGGKYIGNIGESNAQAFQSTLTVLESIIERYIALQDEMDEIAHMHEHNIGYILDLLDAYGLYDEETDDLMVSENGHVWIVKAKEEYDADE